MTQSNPVLWRQVVGTTLNPPFDWFYWLFLEAWNDPSVKMHPLVVHRNRIHDAVVDKVPAAISGVEEEYGPAAKAWSSQPLHAGLSAYLATVES